MENQITHKIVDWKDNKDETLSSKHKNSLGGIGFFFKENNTMEEMINALKETNKPYLLAILNWHRQNKYTELARLKTQVPIFEDNTMSLMDQKSIACLLAGLYSEATGKRVNQLDFYYS